MSVFFDLIRQQLTDNQEYELLTTFDQLVQDQDKEIIDFMASLNDEGVIIYTKALKLELFKILYNSGVFCYVALDKSDFLDNWEYNYFDLKLISNIVNCATVELVNRELKSIMFDLYLLGPRGLDWFLLD